jgi:hypothetical protein
MQPGEALSDAVAGRSSVEQPSAPALNFDDFFRSEYVAVVTLAAVLAGSRALAEDIAQEAFGLGLRTLGSSRTSGRLGAPGCCEPVCVVGSTQGS